MHKDFGNEESSRHKIEDVKSKNDLPTTDTLEEDVTSLSNVLERLISLDESWNFVEPVDKSLVPNYSEVHTNSMCFATMRQKVHSKQYISWAAFMGDFEFICYNAMECNEKCSKVWGEASSLLRQGKKYLEQLATRAETILGREHNITSARNVSTNEAKLAYNDEGGCEEEDLRNKSKILQEDGGGSSLGMPLLYACKEMQPFENVCDKVPEVVSTIVPLELQGGLVDTCKPYTKQLNTDLADVEVDILDCTVTAELRIHSEDGQATECLSSFGNTESDTPSCDEVDSLFRDANGGAAAAENDNAQMPKRRRSLLDPNWKDCKSDIERRCHWLEVRIKELQSLTAKYDRIMERVALSKSDTYAQSGALQSSAARIRPIGHLGRKGRFLQRRRKKMLENTGDLSAYMSRHALFSIYEKKRKAEVEGISVEGANDEPQLILPDVADGIENEDNFGDGAEGLWPKYNSDSSEQFLWDIEVLQMHVQKLRNQLKLSKQAALKKLPAPLRIPGRGISAPKLSAPPSPKPNNNNRRRISDYDMSDVVMPGNLLPASIEAARHDFIKTPQWHLIDPIVAPDSSTTGGASTSEENTDDEVYIERHAEMELKERQQRSAKRSKGSSKPGKMAMGKLSLPSTKGGNAKGLKATGEPFCAASVCRGKRSKRQRIIFEVMARKSKFFAAFMSSQEEKEEDKMMVTEEHRDHSES